MTSGVYVLQLKDSSKYYVGKSDDIEKRINNHKECSEKCAKFVKLNGGVNKVLSPLTPIDNNLSNWEKDETIARMIKHGYNNVRGWEFTNTNKLTKEDLDMIKKSIMGLGDRCRKCGNNGHFASECNSEKASWLQKLEKCYPCETSCNVMNNLLDSRYDSSDEFVSKEKEKENIITELAKTGRAKCQNCKEIIEKGTYRVGINYDFKGKISTKWYHQKCYYSPANNICKKIGSNQEKKKYN